MSISQTGFGVRAPSVLPRPEMKPGRPTPKLLPKTAPKSLSKMPPEKDKPKKPDEQRLLQQRDRLQREQKRIDQKLKMVSQASYIRKLAMDLLAAEQYIKIDPREAFDQIRPVLNSMRLTGVEPAQTKVLAGVVSGKNTQYEVLIRREFAITADNITRIHREVDSFDRLEWTSKGICAYVWAPFENPEAAETSRP